MKTGYAGYVETGYGIGTYSNDFTEAVHVNLVNGYRFNPFLAVGLGVGMRYFSQKSETLVPIFASVRINMRDRKVTPYANIDLGHSMVASNHFATFGTMLTQGVGISIKVSPRSSMNVGFKFETLIFDGSNTDGYWISEIFSSSFRTVGFNIGMTF